MQLVTEQTAFIREQRAEQRRDRQWEAFRFDLRGVFAGLVDAIELWSNLPIREKYIFPKPDSLNALLDDDDLLGFRKSVRAQVEQALKGKRGMLKKDFAAEGLSNPELRFALERALDTLERFVADARQSKHPDIDNELALIKPERLLLIREMLRTTPVTEA